MTKGLVIVFIFMLAIPSIVLAKDSTENGAQVVLSSSKGCFALGTISLTREDQFLLDSCTGRIWQLVRDQNTGAVFLRPVIYQENPPIKGAPVLPSPLRMEMKVDD